MGITFSDPDVDTDETTTQLAALTPTDNGVIIGNGAAFVVESGATLKTSLGLTIGVDVQAYDADLTSWAGVTPGTGIATALAVNVGTAGAPVINGGALGTPSSGTLTSATGLPVSTGISGLGTGIATALAINTGSAGAPVLINGALGTPSSGTLTSATGLPVSTGISGLGTSVATALAVNVGTAGAFVVNGGALGTPSSGTLTSCTGLPTSGLTTTATNDSAAAGKIGEVISSSVASGSAVSLTNSTAANVTSISLTAGDWDVYFASYYVFGVSTSITRLLSSISATTATLDVSPGAFNDFQTPAIVPGNGGNSSINVGPHRISLSGTTTIYAIAFATFTISTASAYGIIRARRVR